MWCPNLKRAHHQYHGFFLVTIFLAMVSTSSLVQSCKWILYNTTFPTNSISGLTTTQVNTFLFLIIHVLHKRILAINFLIGEGIPKVWPKNYFLPTIVFFGLTSSLLHVKQKPLLLMPIIFAMIAIHIPGPYSFVKDKPHKKTLILGKKGRQ